jgi:4a-hydroxytetrahydrobiopterin dehydratase
MNSPNPALNPDVNLQLTEPEVQALIEAHLPQWQLQDGQLCRSFATAGWKATLMLVNAVGLLSELAWHHPELRVHYASVEVRLRTHQPAGLTHRDVALARKIDEVLSWQPGQDPHSGLTGPPPNDPVAACWGAV